MLGTLDKYVIRNFLYSYMLWFLVMMGLRIVSDLFVNMDEFTEHSLPFFQQVAFIGGYYAYQSLVYFQELGGPILGAAAAFALARMNYTNELTAILASGVSLHRVIAPVIMVGLALAGLDVLDQEVLIPRVKEHLVRSRDELPGTAQFAVTALADANGNCWWSSQFTRADETLDRPMVLLRDPQHRLRAKISAQTGRPADGGRWAFQDASIAFVADRQGQNTSRVLTWLDPEQFENQSVRTDGRLWCTDGEPATLMAISADRVDLQNRRLVNPEFSLLAALPANGYVEPQNVLVTIRAAAAIFSQGRKPADHGYDLIDGEMLVQTDLTASDLALRQSSRYLSYMSSGELSRLLETGRVPDPQAAELARHTRFTQPLTSLIMLLLALPFILSRERNVKSSASLCLVVVGLCYVTSFLMRYMAGYGLPPVWAAWLPVLVFGPLAIAMLDSLKT